jgi:3-hydroxyacyl-CoA dehydrogenase
LVDKITENGQDVWQLLGLAIQGFHMRMGTMDTSNMIAIDICASIHDEELVDVTKEFVLPTALVNLHLLRRFVVTADQDVLGLDETCPAGNVRI